MKVKLAAATAAALLIAAQIWFGGGKKKTSPAAMPQPPAAVATADDDNAATPPEDAPPPPKDVPPRPAASEVAEISVGSGDSALHLERLGGDWDVVGATSAPANPEKIEKLLTGLLRGELRPLPESARVTTGLEDGGGLPIRLTTADGGDYEMRIGLRPEDSYDAVYASLPGGGVNVLSADVRGELGLWKNDPDLTPDASAWIEKTALAFDPAEAVRLEASYPDHRIAFAKDADGEWQAEGYVPGDEWSRKALDAWLEDLSRFRITGVDGAGELPKDGQKLHEIKITLAGGAEKTVRVSAHHAGESMVAESSDSPGRMFSLPDWRFRKYFRRLPWLFPKAAPHFELRDVRFIDIRQGGETVKFANRPDGWHALASAYPVRTEAVERLARVLSTLRPEDYAAPDFKTIRPLFAGPLVEVILAGGDVHQYRLAGRHPLFPWRYVILDGKSIFSISDAEAGVVFPGFADVLDLGRVMPRRRNGDILEIRFEELPCASRFTLRRKDDDGWEAGRGDRLVDVDREKADAVVNGMLDWAIAGFYNLDARKTGTEPMYRLVVTDKEKNARTIQFLDPEERDIPYILDSGRAFLLDRREFFNWFGEMRALAAETDVPQPLPVEEAASETETHAETATPPEEPAEHAPPEETPTEPVAPENTEENPDEEAPEPIPDAEKELPDVAPPPVDIPLSDPSANLDGDLIHPPPPEADGMADEVERFVDGFIGKTPDLPPE